MTETFEPISIGFACDGKYQIARNLYARHYPHGNEVEFRNMLFRIGGTPSPFTRHIFDWMICPRAAVCAYLERDFQGVFERADLVIDEAGVVKHRELLTLHPHDFHAPTAERLTEAMIDAQYPAFRSKYEFLAERFRQHLLTPGPYLYVYKEIVKLADAERLMALLQARSAHHRFDMLFVDTEGAVNQVLNNPRLHKGWLPAGDADKPPERLWEGPDAAWDKILDGFPLSLPGAAGAPAQPAPDSAPGPRTSRRNDGRPPRQGWRVLTETAKPSDFLADYLHVSAAEGLQRYFLDGAIHGFDHPSPDDHMFCHFIPAEPLAAGGWARLTLTWPTSPHPRASVALQDQGCRHGMDIPKGHQISGAAETTVLRLHPGADHLRLVLLPAGEGRSVLPTAIRLEVHEPALEPPAAGVMDRLRRLLGGR